jgi:hypothetical protein
LFLPRRRGRTLPAAAINDTGDAIMRIIMINFTLGSNIVTHDSSSPSCD